MSIYKKHSRIGCFTFVFSPPSPLLSLKYTAGLFGLFSSISHSYRNMKNAAELAALMIHVCVLLYFLSEITAKAVAAAA